VRHTGKLLAADLARHNGHNRLALLLTEVAEAAAVSRLRAAAAVARAQRPLDGDAAKLEALLEREKLSQHAFRNTALSIMTLHQLMAVADDWGAGDTMLAAQTLLLLPSPHFSLAGLAAACGGAAVLLTLPLLAAWWQRVGRRWWLRLLWRRRRAHAPRVAGGLLRSLRDAITKRVDAFRTAWLERRRTPPPPLLPPQPITTASMSTGSARRRRSTVAATSSAAARGNGVGAIVLQQPEPEQLDQQDAAMEHPAAASAAADAANDVPPPPVLDAPPAAAQPPAPIAVPSVPPPPPPAEDEAASECALCMDAPREAAFVPCGHRQTCMACAEHMLRSGARARCPFCNVRATQAIRIFL
jgi:hypothetical protein